MASFCGGCGKPLAVGGKFCGGCGAPISAGVAQTQPVQPQPAAGNPPPAAPVKSGSSALKILLVIVLLGGAVVVMAAAGAFYLGRKKIAEWRKDSGIAAIAPDSSALAAGHHSRSDGSEASALLSKEEVGAIIGYPVIDIEMSGKADAHYKTASMGVEASIEVERKDDEADAIQSIEAARHVTEHAFGGKGGKVPGVGDDAVYGAFNVLYVRKNDMFLTIMPPNLQQAAQFEQYNNLTSQPLGSDGQKAAMDKLQQTMKGDPTQGSLAKPDAMSGAVDLIHHAASERGNEYETKARLMARQMAEKVLAKIGT